MTDRIEIILRSKLLKISEMALYTLVYIYIIFFSDAYANRRECQWVYDYLKQDVSALLLLTLYQEQEPCFLAPAPSPTNS